MGLINMIKTELREILTYGENSGVEFKRDELRPEELARELVAFSNLEGGMVILGVEDDGTITGLKREKLEEWVMNICRDKIRPPIIPFFEIIRAIEKDKDVAIVRVPQGYTLTSCWHNNSNRYLIRVGSQSREASTEEIERILQRRSNLRAEKQPVSGTLLQNLDTERLYNYFTDLRQQEVPAPEENEAWQSLLNNIEIMTKECVTVGGLLLFGKTPQKFLPHTGINAVAYSGMEKDYAALERTTLTGSLTPLIGKGNAIVDKGLVEQALDFVHRNTRPVVELKGGRRVERPAYPYEVLREGIVNALIHRDYLLTNTDIELSIFNDRLEIVSPGRLPNGVTPDSMRLGIRATRNHFLKDIMRDYGYLEGGGLGIPRKIIIGMKQHNGTEPGLIEQNERFIVQLLA